MPTPGKRGQRPSTRRTRPSVRSDTPAADRAQTKGMPARRPGRVALSLRFAVLAALAVLAVVWWRLPLAFVGALQVGPENGQQGAASDLPERLRFRTPFGVG